MERTTSTGVACLGTLAAWCCVAVANGQSGRSGDLPTTAKAVAAAKSRLDGQLFEVEAVQRNTDKVVSSDFAECEGLYRYLTEQFSLAPRGIIEAAEQLSQDVERLLTAVGPLADVQRELDAKQEQLEQIEQDVTARQTELERLRNTTEETQRQLSALEQRQGEAILQWLLDHEGQAFHSDQIIVGGYQITIVRSMLFGTFAVSYPTDLGAGEVGEIRVTYMPTLFAGDDLAPQRLEIGPTGTSIELPSEVIELGPGRMSGGTSSGDVEFGKFTVVDRTKPTSWSWRVTAGDAFQGIEFDVVMSAARIDGPNNQRHETEVAGLKVTIKRRGPPGWWSWFTNTVLNGWVIAGFTIIMTELVRDGIPWWRRRQKERRIAGFGKV